MDTLLTSAIAFALSQVVLSGLLLLGHNRWAVQERLYGLLLIAITSYLLWPVTRDTQLVFLMEPLQTAVPGLFWLFSASLFDDHFRLKKWQVTLVAITILCPSLGEWLLRRYGVDWRLVLVELPQLLEFVLLGLALLVVARHWRVDLIEPRRHLRLWFCGLNGCYILVLIFLREIVFPESERLASLQYLPVGGILLATNALLLEYKSSIWTRSTAEVVAAPAVAVEPGFDEESPELIGTLLKLMETEAVYREMGLTIGQLAARMKLPEYRLRRAINAGLGYRNFNDFLNHYRIREASRRLGDPGQADIPVLTIALDTGFRSLSSFNKAFKQTFKETPTAYRRSHAQG
ncbi:AraC family transcriptional regulator [Exilibacterium tricleocarpae]|uniref:AraC family transcriptional regulator n=1 Tax=Exilibacterium tricleocarpae TaxID=2591008 RepID=A0A545SYV2_9GAMM|nr:helix-turn-helix domain-containing protein [Exilibacterium tricleocarpae]TQV70143.1 AraC family transcriptional regulator [Exilibacterium tricleocarpae]